MNDFFPTYFTQPVTQSSNNVLPVLFKKIYNISITPSGADFFGINLHWPQFSLPTNYCRYFLSFHTEYIDVNWIVAQARLVYPKPILLVSDFEFSDTSIFLDNVTVVHFITIDNQLTTALHLNGMVPPGHAVPKFKLSSLSFRVSQYKKFITAYLLKTFPKEDMILTYHNNLGKQEDLHGHPSVDYLDQLTFNFGKTLINFDDNFSTDCNFPIGNLNYKSAAFQDALINLTNESFHYSNTIFEGKDFKNPGPYITEKTFKPLLASRPFLAVGQAGTYRYLNHLGFKTDFGFNSAYDDDSRDLTRIKGIFDAIDDIACTPIAELYEKSLPSVIENYKYLNDRAIVDRVLQLNRHSTETIQSFFE
jgi:hypothetical protein